MNYDTSQNPSTNYSNSQNPSSSYSNNQNPTAPPPRVAQANTTASNARMLSDKAILDKLFPDEMKNVRVLNYLKVPSDLVRDYKYGAWTNSEKEIFINDALEGFERIYVLYHEGIHIRQFKKNKSRPKLFQEMLKAELEAYPAGFTWLNSKQAKKLNMESDIPLNLTEYRKGVLEINYQIIQTSWKGILEILSKQPGLSTSEIDKIYFNYMTHSLVYKFDSKVKTPFNMIPNKFTDEAQTKRYSINDLYDKTTNKTFYPLPKKNKP